MSKQKKNSRFMIGVFVALFVFALIGAFVSWGRIEDGRILTIHGPRLLGSLLTMVVAAFFAVKEIKKALKQGS